MDWWKPLAVLAVALLAFVAVGGLVWLLRTAIGSLAILVVVVLLVLVILALETWGTAPNGSLSTPYWGR